MHPMTGRPPRSARSVATGRSTNWAAARWASCTGDSTRSSAGPSRSRRCCSTTRTPRRGSSASRLYREAAAAGALSHPNIVTIFDIVEDGSTTAVAMEFIEGRSLASIISERAPLPFDLAARYLRSDLRRRSTTRRATASCTGTSSPPTSSSRRGPGEGHRLRRRAPRALDHDAGRHRAGVAQLHVARAGARAAAGRPVRSVLRRRRLLRDDHARAAVRGQRRRHDDVPHRPRAADAARAVQSRRSAPASPPCSIGRWRRTRPIGTRRARNLRSSCAARPISVSALRPGPSPPVAVAVPRTAAGAARPLAGAADDGPCRCPPCRRRCQASRCRRFRCQPRRTDEAARRSRRSRSERPPSTGGSGGVALPALPPGAYGRSRVPGSALPQAERRRAVVLGAAARRPARRRSRWRCADAWRLVGDSGSEPSRSRHQPRRRRARRRPISAGAFDGRPLLAAAGRGDTRCPAAGARLRRPAPPRPCGAAFPVVSREDGSADRGRSGTARAARPAATSRPGRPRAPEAGSTR